MDTIAPQSFTERYAAAFGRNQALLLRLSRLTEPEVEASGAVVRDRAGIEWLDFGSFGVHLLGHRHPVVIARAARQIERMGLSTKILGSSAATECAESLIQHTPPHLDRVIFSNSGAEAVDVAMKLAMLATNRTKLVALRHSYHGKSFGAMSISDALKQQPPFTDAFPVQFIDSGDTDALDDALVDRDVAALFAEPVQGEGGINSISPSFLSYMRDRCKNTGTILVLDEIQTGLGRCGSLWRSAGEIEPDVLLVGKTLGGGLVPISATVFSSEIVPERASDPILLASSFSGGALSSAIAEAVVELASSPSFLGRVNELGQAAIQQLKDGLGDMDGITVRGEGLMIGVEVNNPAVIGNAIIQAAERNVLVTFCLHNPKVMRVYPPAIASDEQLQFGLSAVVDAIRIASTAACPKRPDAS